MSDTTWASVAWLLPLAYLCGSIPFGVIVTRFFVGQDVRASGSGNIGATNVARVAGKKWGAVVLVLDALKSAAPVALSVSVLPTEPVWHAVVGYVAFLGHVYPVWLKFKGGKGVATALGALVVLLPWAALVGFVLWAVIVSVFRVSSVGSLVGGAAAIATGFFQGRPLPYAWLGVALLASMVYTHRDNIQRMRQGRENRV